MSNISVQENPSIPVIDGFQSHFHTVNGVRLHYLIGGRPTGKPVVLWHGFLGSSQSWKKVMALLANAGYSVLVPDMRGYGDSDKPLGTHGYDARNLSEDFRGLVKEIGFGAGKLLTLVAHDMGAAPALIWCADHPGEINALVYMEMVVMLDGILQNHLAFNREVMESPIGTMWWWILPHATEALELFFVGKEAEFLPWFYNRTSFDKNKIGEEQISEILRTFAGKEGVNGAFGIYRAVFESIAQTHPLIETKVTVPIVAVGGAHSLGAHVGDMVSQVAENVTTRVIEDAGHFITEEQPVEVFKIIQELTSK